MDKISTFIDIVLEANQSINLTGAKTYDELLKRHVNDSLALLDFVDIKDEYKILDMGTGAGFPAIPLAIKTSANFVLVDSLSKRISFLESVCDELELTKVKPMHARAEEFLRKAEYRETFDIALSRAVAPLNLLLEYTIPALKVGAKFYAYKSSNIDEEIIEAENALNLLKSNITNVFDYSLYDSSGQKIELKILEITKFDKTDDRYPRRVGIPAKRPL